MRYNTVFWDIDNTLLDFSAAQKRGIKKSLARYGIEIDGVHTAVYDQINRSYWEMLEYGEVTKQELEIGRFKEFLSTIGEERTLAGFAGGDLNRAAKMINDEYEETLAEEPVLIDGAKEICATLHEMGVRQYAVTNGSPSVQRNKITLSGLNVYFDDLFISEELGCVKPQKEFFTEVVKRIPDYHAERTLIIGDSLSSDMRGGLNAGVDRCWYNPKHVHCTVHFPIQYEIRRLCEAEGIVAGE